MYSGVGLDVMGEGYDNLSQENHEEIITAFPRNNFKKKIIPHSLVALSIKQKLLSVILKPMYARL